MIRELAWKPDFGKTVERFEAWWVGEVIDRPPVTLHVHPSRPYRGPVRQHHSLRERWMDVEYVVDSAVARMECMDYVGDNFPMYWPNLGPEITATLFGCELEFSETTSWSKPVVHEPEDWHRILQTEPDFGNVYWRTIEQMTDYAIERSEGRYIVGITDLHGNYDILAALRDPQALCMDMIDCPELVIQVGRHAAEVFVQCFERSYAKIAEAGFGCTTWLNAYHEGSYYVPSCDFWLMVSPEMAREMILPEILFEMQALERSIFHLDGVGALKHLRLLLEIPNLHAIQWVYGAGQGPAARWIDVYRQCIEAGKSVQVVAETAEDALTVLEAVGAKGVWLTIGEGFSSVDEAETFLREVEKVSASSRGEVGAMIPVELRCEYLTRPLGIDVPQPRLSWTLWSDERGQRQTAYRILVASTPELLAQDRADLWDTGKVDSDRTCHVAYGGKPLHSLQRCYWKVQVWDRYGKPSDWSEVSWWEMGILSPEEWQAKWIGAPIAEPAPLFRKEFTVQTGLLQARALICGLGYYELYLNGERIGKQVLDPAQTDYEKRAFYVVHDVTNALCEGMNCIGVMLGNGWFHQAIVWGGMSYGEPVVLVQLVLEYEDGRVETVCTDESWKTTPGPVLKNNVYAGEEYDARRDIPGWSEPGLDDSRWQSVRVIPAPTQTLQSQLMPPIKRTREFPPIALTSPQPGVWIYDMGQNFAGWVRLKVSAPAGTTITLRFAEELHPDGTLNPASTGVFATTVVQTDRYTCKGVGVEVWEPRFTYHGFRYVEMTGYPGTPTLDMLEAVVVHTVVPSAGTFECSDEMLNRIHRTAIWTQISNLHSVPTDCPHRERCGWLGDAHVSAEMTIYNFEMAPFWTKYLEDIETSLTENGLPTFVAPGKRKIGEASPDWGTAVVQIPWYLYLYYGDTRVLERHYATMKRWVEHLLSISEGYIVSAGLGDWCAPGSVPGNTPIPITSTAVFYLDAILMHKIATILGKTEDATRFGALARNIKQAFIERFYDGQNHTFGSQAADALALAWGLAPEGHEQAIADRLARDVMEKHEGHHSTGILGSRHLYWALSEYGHGEVAMTLLHQLDYPSIGHLFSLGATTFWECWSEPEIDQQEGPRSANHPMQGGYDAWFFYGVAGILPSEQGVGFKRIVFKPQLLPALRWARASYRSMHGLITSHWRRAGERLLWDITVPPNTTATVYVPASDAAAVTENGQPLERVPEIQVVGREGSYLVLDLVSGTYRLAAAPVII